MDHGAVPPRSENACWTHWYDTIATSRGLGGASGHDRSLLASPLRLVFTFQRARRNCETTFAGSRTGTGYGNLARVVWLWRLSTRTGSYLSTHSDAHRNASHGISGISEAASSRH